MKSTLYLLLMAIALLYSQCNSPDSDYLQQKQSLIQQKNAVTFNFFKGKSPDIDLTGLHFKTVEIKSDTVIAGKKYSSQLTYLLSFTKDEEPYELVIGEDNINPGKGNNQYMPWVEFRDRAFNCLSWSNFISGTWAGCIDNLVTIARWDCCNSGSEEDCWIGCPREYKLLGSVEPNHLSIQSAFIAQVNL